MGKGQIFIIISVITIVVIVLIRTSLNLTNILENKRFLELGLERVEFKNLRSELSRTMQVSYNMTNISENINNFMGFAKDSFSSRATILTGVGLLASFPQVNQGQNTRLNVTFMNYMDEDITSLNLTFNNSQQNFTSIGKSSAFTTSFVFATQSSLNFSLLMNFTTPTTNSTENITIPVELSTSKFVGFFDIKISSSRLEHRDKFTETIILNSTRRV
jgi:hypothetical protein